MSVTTSPRAGEALIFRIAPAFTTLTTIGLAVALIHEGATATVTLVGALFGLIAAAMTLLTMRHQQPRNGASAASIALFYVALGLMPIAFTCIVIVSWPH